MTELRRYKDFTVKARIENLEAVHNKLMLIGAQFIGTDDQLDTYFRVARGKLKHRKGTIENLVTHYTRFQIDGYERTEVSRYDVNPSDEMLKELYQKNEVIGITRKSRRIFKIDNIKIHLDEVGNECFLEVEAIDRDGGKSDGELQHQCDSVLRQLGILPQDLVGTGYIEQQRKV